jgi:N-glycosylase/DNA lyase
VAILDRHILRLMRKHQLIEDIPKSLTRKRYLALEGVLERLVEPTDMSLGELDLYLWYLQTGEVLK